MKNNFLSYIYKFFKSLFLKVTFALLQNAHHKTPPRRIIVENLKKNLKYQLTPNPGSFFKKFPTKRLFVILLNKL